MQFQHTVDWVIDISPHTGEPKTRTSRIKKLNEVDVIRLSDSQLSTLAKQGYIDPSEKYEIASIGRWSKPESDQWVYEKWRVSKTYAVQPNRGVKSVGRIQICSITEQDVRQITEDEAKAEGFDSIGAFLEVWTKMHDKPAYSYFMLDLMAAEYRRTEFPIGQYRYDAWYEYLAKRPAERYTAWILTFKLVKE